MDGVILFVAATSMFADPVPAQPPEGAVVTASRIVCKSSSTAGSRIPRDRVCKSKAEWDMEQLIVERSLRQNLEGGPRAVTSQMLGSRGRR
jgi:hypothetical protein